MALAEAGAGRPIVLIHGLGGTFRYWLGHGPAALAGGPVSWRSTCRGSAARSRRRRPSICSRRASACSPRARRSERRDPCWSATRSAGRSRCSSPSGTPSAWRVWCWSPRPASHASARGAVTSLLPLIHAALRHPRTWERLLAEHAALRRIVFREMLADPAALDPFEARMLVGGAAVARQLDDSIEASLACDLQASLAALSGAPRHRLGRARPRRCRSPTPSSQHGSGPTRRCASCVARGTCPDARAPGRVRRGPRRGPPVTA